MDVSRLLVVVSDVEAECREGLSPLLKGLVQQYTAARDAPTTDNTATIQAAVLALNEFSNSSVFLQYPPSKLAVLHAIGGYVRVGPGFRERLNNILSVPGQTTAGIVTGLTQLEADLQTFRKACTQAKAGLELLGITPHTIPEGVFEVGVLIPEEIVDKRLGQLTKELEGWNKIVRGFQEVAGEDEREVTVVGLSSGSYEIYLPLGVIAAGLLSRTIDKVLDWYLRILEIRKRRLELANLGAPIAETNAIKKHERDLLDKEIRTLAGELIKEVHAKVDANRKNELETQLTLSIRQIARFVDKGGTVEVDSTRPEVPDEPTAPPEGESESPEATQEYNRLMQHFEKVGSELKRIGQILDAGSSLRRLPDRSEPILQLGDGDSEGEPAEMEKAAKKRS